MLGLYSLIVLSVISLVLASPVSKTKDLFERDVALCAQFQSYNSPNGYNLNNNAWGSAAAESGSSCTFFQSPSPSGGVTWKSNWQWFGPNNQVKGYPYSGKKFDVKLLSDIKDMQTLFDWNYSNEAIVANVAYDMFSAKDPYHSKSSGDFELMIWLANFGGMKPISNTNQSNPIASPTIGGYQWDLYKGYNRDREMHVYTFVVKSGPVKRFQSDAKLFWNYLRDYHGFREQEQHLLTFQAGTEPVRGNPTTFNVREFRGVVRV